MKIDVNVPRTVKVGDYIYGHFIYSNNGEEETTDFGFVLIDRSKGINASIRDSKHRNLDEAFEQDSILNCPIVYTDSPLGKTILNRFPDTTFVIEDVKFYIDKIMRYNEAIKEEKHTK